MAEGAPPPLDPAIAGFIRAGQIARFERIHAHDQLLRLTLNTSDGGHTEALLSGVPSSAPGQLAVLMFHPDPIGASMYDPVLDAVQSRLTPLDVLSMRFAFRTSKLDDYSEMQFHSHKLDAVAAVDALLGRCGPAPRLLIVAESYGCWVAADLLLDPPAMRGVRPEALVLISPVTLAALEPMAPFGRLQAALRAFTPPALFLAGEHDALSPPRRLRTALPVADGAAPPSYRIIAGAGHYYTEGGRAAPDASTRTAAAAAAAVAEFAARTFASTSGLRAGRAPGALDTLVFEEVTRDPGLQSLAGPSTAVRLLPLLAAVVTARTRVRLNRLAFVL